MEGAELADAIAMALDMHPTQLMKDLESLRAQGTGTVRTCG